MYNKKLSNGKNISIYFAIIAIVALALVFIFAAPASTYAEADAGDAFDVVFPLENYFQSERPTLVAANERYLIVYDSAQSRLYVRGEDLSTYFYDLSEILTVPAEDEAEEDDSAAQSPVAGIYAVGSHALIAVGAFPQFEMYSLDLTDVSASPEKKAATVPERAYCFASDGERLYAKNAAGEIAIYDENMSVLRDDIYNDILAGKASMAGEGDRVYLFDTDQSMPMLYIYDSEENAVSLSVKSKLVRTAYIGDVIYAQISPAEEIENHSKIVCLDKETGEELYTSNFMPESFCAYKDKLYSINGGSVTEYRFKQVEGDEVKYTLEPEETLSMAGSDFMHLNSPSDIISSGEAIIVADGNNTRLAFIDASLPSPSIIPYQLDGKPLRVTGDTNRVYTLLETGDIIGFEISDGALVPSITLRAPEEEATQYVDIAYFDSRLYALASDKLYVYISGSFAEFADIEGAKRIAVADGGRCLYVLADDGIVMLDENGDTLPARLAGDFSQAADIAVDYAGNIFIMYSNRAECYQNDIYSLKKISEHALFPSSYAATATSCALIGDELYFTAEESFVGKFNVDAVTKEGYLPPALPIFQEDSTYHFAKLKEGTSSYFIPADDNRADRVISANSNVLLVIDSPAPDADGLAYAMDGDKLYVIPTEDFDTVEPTALDEKAYLMKDDGAIYHLPYREEGSVALVKGTQGIWAVSDCAGYDDNGWLIVRYDGKHYFVSAELLEEDFFPPADPDDPNAPQRPDNPKALYGRAKASRVGGTVNIYSDMSESSVVTRIVDGKKVEVLATLDNYYQVRYGDYVGFMRASEVKIGGLTTVQIVAIVLSIFVLIAGTGICTSIFIIKKRENDEAENAN